MQPRTRRDLIRAVPAGALGVACCTGSAAGVSSERLAGVADRSTDPASVAPDEPFDPAVHGFGFRNWSTASTTFPEHDHELVTQGQVTRAIGDDWTGPFQGALGVNTAGFSSRLTGLVARQVYVSANQLSATNGHCYGMTFAAQAFYEDPDRIPFGREVASELTHPAEPLDDPDHAPVGQEVDLYQVIQILDPFAWIGRRGLARPAWIDTPQQVRNVEAVVEEYGTAGITVIDAGSGSSHQVLAYDVERSGDDARIDVYDPNRAASAYASGAETTVVVEDGEMRPYGRYDTFLFNRYDRIIAARTDASNVPAFDRAPDRVRQLFSAVLFLLDTEDACLTVVDPNGEPVGRDDATFADRSMTEYHAMRYAYDAIPGEYAVEVDATADTDYTLTVEAADPDGGMLDREIEGSLAAGESERFVVDLPASSADTGSVDHADPDDDRLSYAAAGVVGGAAAAGTVGYGLRRYRRSEAADGE